MMTFPEQVYSRCLTIICMFNLICVTNRHLCKGNFLEQIEKIVQAAPAAIILREKDLPEAEYRILAKQVLEICHKHHKSCILHSYVDVAIELKVRNIHLPMAILRRLPEDKKRSFTTIGASCHSVDEAIEAQSRGCTYITAGHIFSTDCKKGVPPRGLDFLEKVCKAVSIPVYAIGGIHLDNIEQVRQTGARGACIMSGFMKGELHENSINHSRQ